MEAQRRQGGRIAVDAPPALPEATPVNPVARLMPIVLVAAVVGMSALYLRSGASSPRSPMFLVLPAMMLVSVIGMLAHGGRGGARTAEINAQRAEYLRYLDTVEAALGAGAADQYSWLHHHHPEPAALWPRAGTARMWQRDDAHPEFLRVRVGIGDADPTTAAVLPDLGSDDDADPVTVAAVRALSAQWSCVHDVPVLVSLLHAAVLTVTGEPGACRAVARALVCQAAVAHSPAVLAIGVDAECSAEWDWLAWLPHARDGDTPGRRMVITDRVAPPVADGVTVVRIRAARSPLVVDVDGVEVPARYDTLSPAEALACARRTARWSPRRAASRHDGWPALMTIDDPVAFDPAAH